MASRTYVFDIKSYHSRILLVLFIAFKLKQTLLDEFVQCTLLSTLWVALLHPFDIIVPNGKRIIASIISNSVLELIALVQNCFWRVRTQRSFQTLDVATSGQWLYVFLGTVKIHCLNFTNLPSVAQEQTN